MYGAYNEEPPSPQDLYDMLAAMVARTPWQTEEEKLRWTLMVDRIREVNLFGYMAQKTTVVKGEKR